MERKLPGNCRDIKEFKVSLELAGEKRISGNDLFNLLENIAKYGSISRAAAEMGVSYRYAWGIVGAAEKALGLELVYRQAGGQEGGRTALSREGRELLERYRAFRREVDSQLERFINSSAPVPGHAGRPLLLASTMEPVETGLLDVLEEAFFRSRGIIVRHIALGSGRALELARQGRVDMALTHAPGLEKEFLQGGWGLAAYPVMANDFVLVGPPADPAGVGKLNGTAGAKGAFRCIAFSASPFVSRGDSSGTHLCELQLWEGAEVVPQGDWYIVSSGIAGNMGVLRLAREKGAYTLVDRATLLIARCEESVKVFQGYEEGTALPGELDNVFSLVLVSPQRVPSVNYEGAREFAQWIRGEEGGEIISAFGRESFGRPLFARI